ncbi:hypothetical protein EON79_18100, partial [bacterium]
MLRRAALFLPLLPGLALAQGQEPGRGIAFLAKPAPGNTYSRGLYAVSVDARRKTALLYSNSPEVWRTGTLGGQYYVRSFEGRPLDRLPIEEIQRRMPFPTAGTSETVRMADDGEAVWVYADTGFESPSMVYNVAQQKVFHVPAALGLVPLQVVGVTTLIATKDFASTVRYDLATGTMSPLANGVFDRVTADGRYLLRWTNPKDRLTVLDTTNGQSRTIPLTGLIADGTLLWVAPDGTAAYFLRGASLAAAKLVKLDPFTLQETEYAVPD